MDEIRVSDADRRDTVDLLDAALGEGRLDAGEHAARVGAAQHARLPKALAELVVDLPRRPGVYAWDNRLRVRGADRERAVAWLDDALAEGRLTEEEHDRRLALVTGAVTYRSLRKPLDGVPGPPGAVRDRLFVARADRDRLITRLARALDDDRIGTGDHYGMQAAASKAPRYGDFDDVATALDRMLRRDLRAAVLRRLDGALAAGRIGAAEHGRLVAEVRTVVRNAALPRLARRLPAAKGATPEWIVGHGVASLHARALSDGERRQAVRALERARHEGRLDMDEYDERVAAAYAAADAAAMRPLLADLVRPAPAPADQPVEIPPDDPVPPPRPERRPPAPPPPPAASPVPRRRTLASLIAHLTGRGGADPTRSG